jgi:hypothetical protein
MARKTENPEQLFEPFARAMEGLFPGGVVSVTAYGSAVGGSYRPGASDVNFLVVLTAEAIRDLSPCLDELKTWARRGVSTPLVVTPEYMSGALDTFPIEFFNMKAAYRVITGEDVLGPLEIADRDLRLQAERELRGKLLKLRLGYLSSEGKPDRLQDLALVSFKDFRFLFRALAHLLPGEAPAGEAEAVDFVCRGLDVPAAPFHSLQQVARGRKPSRDAWKALFRDYIQSVGRLTVAVDALDARRAPGGGGTATGAREPEVRP